MEKQPVSVGLLAHVDAGKTTLSEALLYCSGARRTLGRVDHKSAFLDTHDLERQRGITIFSKQAILETADLEITLVDTPGHADLASEAERVLSILDCAVLVISGTDGVQAHTLTLWRLLRKHGIPTFIFINKMDLPGMGRSALLAQLQSKLSAGCVDFSAGDDLLAEAAAMCDEDLLEAYLETGHIPENALARCVSDGLLFPCCFGSALKTQGIDSLLNILNKFAPRVLCPGGFGARVYKVSRDPLGNRLSWLKVTGGSLQVRQTLTYSDSKGARLEEKIVQLRRYSGDKFTPIERAVPGQLVAVTGLSGTWAGQGLGIEEAALKPEIEPVMTYKVALPAGADPISALQKLRLLEEEDPQLHILWDEGAGQIHVQIMGKIQLEILKSVIAQRFDMDVAFENGRIFYKETIANTVEGVGHFEPLRHYAEVHLLLEPLPRCSGLVFDTACPVDILEARWQNLVMTHLEEKIHRGVLTGSPITDMKITLLVGRAHVKHTEGGDFRQATYRAVRQGLMQAENVLLEPWYQFTLTVPASCVGRAISDIRAMHGQPQPPETDGETATVTGIVPAATLADYADQVAAYTQGLGQLQITLHGYLPCHDQQQVVEALSYDPQADVENTPDSVFCDHGAGFTVKWDKVHDYMHLDSGRKADRQEAPAVICSNLHISEKELEAILKRQFGDRNRPMYHAPANRPAAEKLNIRPRRAAALIVDGYNIIHALPELAETAKSDLDAARRLLCDRLSSYAAFRKTRLVVVFDGWKIKGNLGEKTAFHNIQVVFTKENQTADNYIESLVHEIGRNYDVKVATSDALVQLSSLRSGVLRMSARELWDELQRTEEEMRKYYKA